MGLTLDDAGQGADARTGAIVLIVEAPAVDDGGVVSGLIDVITDGGTGFAVLVVLAFVLVGGTPLAIGAAWLVRRRRRAT